MRLDMYLQEAIEKGYGIKLSRSYIERILESGAVLFNDEVIKKKGFDFDPAKQLPVLIEDKVKNIISVYRTGKKQDEEAGAWDASEMGIELDEYRVQKAADIRPRIIFETDDIIAVDKPQGVSSHPGKGDRGADSMVYQFIKYMREAHKYIPRAGLLHRLDKDTQGLLLFAKNMETYNEVKSQFETRGISKYYLAVCEKTPRMHASLTQHLSYLKKATKGSKTYSEYATTEELVAEVTSSQRSLKLEGYIGRRKGTPYMVYTPDSHTARALVGSKSCVSEVFVISESDTEVQLLFKPHTGRTHQIRAQARYLGAPVQNDRVYGNKDTLGGTMKLCAIAVSLTLKGEQQQISLPLQKIFS